MPPLSLATLAYIKAVNPVVQSGTGQDAWITAMAAAISKQIERELGVDGFDKTTRTELHDVAPGQTLFHLRSFPVDTAASFVVKNEANGDFAAAAAIDSDNYHVDAARGRLQFRGRYYSLVDGPGALQIAYTGGIVASGGDVVAAGYGDLSLACAMQVWSEKQRAPNWGSPGRSVGGASQNFDADDVAVSAFAPRVARILDLYRRGAGVV